MKENEFRCPGQNTMFWKPEDIYDVVCPNCGEPVEFWKDDAKRICKCGHRFLNPKRDLGCLEYCKYAETCMPEMFKGENLKALYRDRLLAAVKVTLKPEESQLQYSQEVAEVADEILVEEGGEPKVVIAAAIMAGLFGRQSQESGSSSSEPKDSAEATTRKILADLGTEREVIEQVCHVTLQGSDHSGSENINFQIVADAQNIVKLSEKLVLLDAAALQSLIEKKLITETGKRLARKRLLSGEEQRT